MTQLQTFRTNVLSRMGLPSTDGRIDSTSLNIDINDALRDYSMRYPWPWLELEETIATIDGTSAYTPGTTWAQTISLRCKSGTQQFLPMRRVDDLGIIDAVNQGTGTEGIPIMYGIFGGQLLVAPTPSGVFNMQHRFRQYETALSGDTDEPLLPAAHDTLIIEYGAAVGFRRLRQMSDSTVAMERYERILEDMRQLYGLQTRFSPSQGGGSGPQEGAT